MLMFRMDGLSSLTLFARLRLQRKDFAAINNSMALAQEATNFGEHRMHIHMTATV